MAASMRKRVFCSSSDSVPIFRVALTGGPCGGKSSGMAAVQNRLTTLGFRVFLVPEVATLFVTGGAPFSPSFSQSQALDFQGALLRSQMVLEDSFAKLAESSAKPSIVLCDRGTTDGRAYLPPHLWEALLERNNLTAPMLSEWRYDAVIHMVTAADGAEEFYTHANNSARTESPQQAREIDLKLQAAYAKHPHLRVIDNSTNFEDKVRRVNDVVCRLAGLPIPTRGFRKFLIKAVSVPIDSHSFRIHDDYLESGGRLRVRTCLEEGTSMSFMSHMRKVQDGTTTKYALKERSMSDRQRTELLLNAEITVTVEKTRTAFLYKNEHYELDLYTNINGEPKNFHVLQVETESPHARIALPPFVQVIREVSNDSSFFFHQLDDAL